MKKKTKTSPHLVTGVLLAGTAVVLAAVILLILASRGGDTAGGFTVDGVPITDAHEELYLTQARAEVAAYYQERYGADPNGAEFWETEFDGQTPAQYRRELARAKLIRDTLERKLAREHGADVPVTLAEIEAARQARNGGEGIKYGPREYGVMEYIAQTQTQARDALKTALLEGELAPGQEDLRAQYAKAPEELLDKGYSARVGFFSYAADRVGDCPAGLEGAFDRVRELWDGTRPGGDIAAALTAESGFALTYLEISYDTASLQKDNDLLPQLAQACRRTAEGEFSARISSGPTWGLAVVLEKDDRGKATFEECQTLLTKLWINEQYEIYLDEAVKHAKISG